MSVPISILIFVAVLLAVVIAHEMGHFFASKIAGVKVLEFAIGFPPKLFSIKRGETEYSLNAVPLGAFVRTAGENDPTVPDSLAGKSPWIRVFVYLAGPLINVLIAFVLFAIFILIPGQVIIGSQIGAEVGSITKGSPAEEAGIEIGDVILKIDGTEIHRSEDMRNAIKNRTTEEITVLVQRGDTEEDFSLVPTIDPDSGNEVIGIGYTWESPYITESERLSFWDATYESGNIIIHAPGFLKDAIINSPRESIAGPVGAGHLAVQVLKHGISNVIFLGAMLNLGIGLFNLFPVPPLDGGGIVIASIEGVLRGKRLPPRAIQFVYMVGAALLLTLFFMITYNDVLRLTTT